MSARIAALAVPEVGVAVVEIGAGTGALTAALAACGGDVLAIEIDPDLTAVLRARFTPAEEPLDLAAAEAAAARCVPGRVRILEADALTVDLAACAPAGPWVAAGNLPYNVATPLLLTLVALPHPPLRIVAMIQRDVADRLTARAGTASYGSLTLAMAARARVRRALRVPPSAFHPPPNVDSAVVVIEPGPPEVPIDDQGRFEQVVRGAFAYRRKTLVNALDRSLGIPRERIVTALAALHLDPETRGERLDLAAFAALARALAD